MIIAADDKIINDQTHSDIEKFKGRILHAHDYRDSRGFDDKNVFIVGIGNSALDIAVELSHVAKSVTISTRRGTWLFHRLWKSGMPYDVSLMTRWYQMLFDYLPWSLVNDYIEYHLQQKLDHDLYGLRPYHRFFQRHPTTNDALPNLLSTGQVVVTEDVACADETGVIVKNGRRFDADVLIYATGYTFKFPYLHPQCTIPIVEQEVDLYKYVFPPDNTSLAVLGLIQPIGSIAPIAEMQARWVAAVWSSRVNLPSQKGMMADIEQTRKIRMRRYFKSTKHTIQVDYMTYMDEIAEMIGVKPNIWKYLFKDPVFAVRLFLCANAPYVYRLNGIGSWEGAKEALNNLPDRVRKPIKNRECRMRRYKRSGKLNEKLIRTVK